jgi:hypothetical protein
MLMSFSILLAKKFGVTQGSQHPMIRIGVYFRYIGGDVHNGGEAITGGAYLIPSNLRISQTG